MQPSTLFLVGGAALLGYLAVRRTPTSTAETPSPSPYPYPTPGPGPAPAGGRYVGAPGFTWPHADKFGTQASFQAWLRAKGYHPSLSGNVRDGATVAAVHSYQRDFNIVRHWLIEQGWQSQIADLSVDGKIGPATIGSMVAVDQNIMPGNNVQSWQALVTQAKGGASPTPTPTQSAWGDHTLCFAAEGSITGNHYPTPHQLGTANKMLLASAISQRQSIVELELTPGRPEYTLGTHTHKVVITKDDLQRLSRGQQVTVQSSIDTSGLTDQFGNPHSHAVTIFCQK